mgnify:CR=1 FL=1
MATIKPFELPKGVELRGESLRIKFSYRGQWCRETLKNLSPTKGNIKFAANKLATIKHEIAIDVFDYAVHFPESRRALLFSGPKATRKTITEAVDEWLDIKKAEVSYSTFSSYNSKANTHIKPKFGEMFLQEINLTMIKHWRAHDLLHLANKTINEIMIVMRGILNSAKADRIIDYNPIDDLKNLITETGEPDPFTKAEITKILSTPTKRIQELNMMKFNFWTGLRVSELIALAWEDIDLSKGIIKIKRANVKGRYKVPKTKGSVREVELLLPAIEALNNQKQHTLLMKPFEVEVTQRDNKTIKTDSLQLVFLNTRMQRPHANDNVVRDRFFTHHLKLAGVRHRGPNQARHTFASQMLTHLVPKEWISKQMGHTSIRTLEKHYAKWIREDASGMAGIVNQLMGFKKAAEDSEDRKSS